MEETKQYVLIRLDDGMTLHASQIAWIEWDETGRAQASHSNIGLGYSLILDPNRGFSYTWLTTDVTSILSESDECIEFKTKNSTYKLTMSTYENESLQ